MGKDFLWRLCEKLALLVGGRLVKRRGDGLGLGATAQLFGWPPIGAASVERIEDNVATILVVKPLHELARRVVHDRRMATLFDLQEELHDEPRLASPGVAHQLDVLSFGALRYPHELLEFGCLEADAIALDGLVEALRRDQHRPFQQATILHFF